MVRNAEACVGCSGGGQQARWEARVRWRDGAAARAYPEHRFHARDLRDVPVQGLVEAGGALPGVESESRGMLRRAWGAEAAGCTQGGRLVCGRAMEQRAGRTLNMYAMFVTCATSQEPMGSLKVL